MDHELVLKRIYDAKKITERKRHREIFVDFTQVKNIDDGAATILLSYCHDTREKGIKVTCNLPVDAIAKTFMLNSGFIKFFKTPFTKSENKNTTIKKGTEKILQKDSAKLIHTAMETVFGADLKNTRLQGMLIELMTNSVNHAYLKDEAKKSWYISSRHDDGDNKVEFCFVDNGDGVINTISVKFKVLIDNEDIIQKAFDGEYRSRTKLKNRGRGLVVIKKTSENLTVRGLKVITNNVLLDFESGVVQKLRTPFSGTFYSWVLDKTCK